jgi:monoamine oxidase/GMP synthase-like glutamine amidotransferase
MREQIREVHDVLVIGAGPSGLMAATHLKHKFERVVVLEARTRVGGRVHDRHVAAMGGTIPLGAAWLHDKGHSPILHKHLEANSVKLASRDDFHDIAVFRETGRRCTEAETQDFLHQLQRLPPALSKIDEPQTSLAAAAEALLGDAYDPDVVQGLINRSLESCSRNASTMPVAAFDGWVDNGVFVVDGFGRLFERMGAALDIRFGEEVVAIAQDRAHAVVQTTHRAYTARYVVSTLPTGVLQSHRVRFDPPLPLLKRRVLPLLDAGNHEKIFLRFPENFWGDVTLFHYCHARRRGLCTQWIAALCKYSGQPILYTNLSGPDVPDPAPTESEAVEIAMCVLRTIFGKVPDPTAVYVTDWKTSEYTQGGPYASPRFGATMSDFDVLGEAHGRVHFAGVDTSSHQTETVEAAMLSGLRVADAIADAHMAQVLSREREAFRLAVPLVLQCCESWESEAVILSYLGIREQSRVLDMHRNDLPSVEHLACSTSLLLIPGSTVRMTEWSARKLQFITTLIRLCYTGRIPMVGICNGHQLISHALGGRVERQRPDGGYRATVVLRDEMQRVGAGGFEVRAGMVAHSLRVVATPLPILYEQRGCILVCLSEDPFVYTTQMHLEYTVPPCACRELVALTESRMRMWGLSRAQQVELLSAFAAHPRELVRSSLNSLWFLHHRLAPPPRSLRGSSPIYDVIVVGAGIGGLYLAERLAGCLVMEAAAQYGGKVVTLSEDIAVGADAGAMRVRGDHARTRALAATLRVELTPDWPSASYVFVDEGEDLDAANTFMRALRRCLDQPPLAIGDDTFRDHCTRVVGEDVALALEHRWVNLANSWRYRMAIANHPLPIRRAHGHDPDIVHDPFGAPVSEACRVLSGELALRFDRCSVGMRELCDRLYERCDAADFAFGCAAQGVDHDGTLFRVRARDGRAFVSRKLVLSIPWNDIVALNVLPGIRAAESYNLYVTLATFPRGADGRYWFEDLPPLLSPEIGCVLPYPDRHYIVLSYSTKRYAVPYVMQTLRRICRMAIPEPQWTYTHCHEPGTIVRSALIDAQPIDGVPMYISTHVEWGGGNWVESTLAECDKILRSLRGGDTQ